MTEPTNPEGSSPIFRRDLRLAYLGTCLGVGVFVGCFAGYLMGQEGWEGKGPADERLGPGWAGMILGALHGFAYGFGLFALLGLLCWTAHSRIKFCTVAVVGLTLMLLHTYSTGGLDQIIDTAVAFPKGLLIFQPTAFLAIMMPMRRNDGSRPKHRFWQLLIALAIAMGCVSETWIVFGWSSVLVALSVGVGLGFVVGLPTIILLKRYQPFDLPDKPRT